jgi:hypothetical protein
MHIVMESTLLIYSYFAGRGVFAKAHFSQGDVLVEYQGRLCEDCNEDDTYVFEIKHKGKTLW